MSEVTDIKEFKRKKAEFVYECACGGQHFYLNKDGTVECRSCKQIVETLCWAYRQKN
jgi:hypothetical protein